MAGGFRFALIFAMAAVAGAALVGRAPAAAEANRCEALADTQPLPGVTIATARRVPLAPPGTVPVRPGAPVKFDVAFPAHCLVQGMIDPHTGADGTKYGLGFALALPDDWNGRFLFQGGGGLNGTLNSPIGDAGAGDRPALARGFAIISTDGGHKGAVFDGKFMEDQQAGLDFYERSVGRVAEVGKALTTRFYGKPIAHAYIAGCSTGGRESMEGVQRFPQLFDGALIGAPAMRADQSRIGGAWAAVAFNKAAPKNAAGKPMPGQLFSAEDKKLLSDAVLDSCDAKDGLKDGFIADPESCHFDPAILICKPGQAGGCLSAAKVEALKIAFAGPKDSRGNQVYPPFFYDTGHFGNTPISFLPTNGPSILGPPDLSLSMDVDQQLRALNEDAGNRLTDTYFWTRMNTFAQRGGKMIFFHGVSDPWFSAQDTIGYYQKLRKDNGDDLARLYLIPGMSHCGAGPALDHFDLLTALMDWVEKQQAPHSVDSTGAGYPGRSRPICPYPQHAHYIGGDVMKAASFECRVS